MSTFRGPNDERAQDNLDIAHHLFLMSLNGELYLAPITQKPERVLDIGTGTGIWAMDFADQHPATEVVGTDLSPIQPRWTPPNCKFEIDDANDDWTFAKNSFDFIHVRYLLGCISDWPRFYGQVMEHLKPGAYLEQVELSTNFKSEDDTVNPDNILGQSGPIFIEAAKTIGMSLTIIDEMKGYIEEAGFEDVVLKEYRWPVGTWSEDPKLKELGRWNQVHLLEGMEGFVLAWLTRIMGVRYNPGRAVPGLATD
ncbi:hypothetical protein MMC20_006382 [Loxospora ochrophaea]|nr:hypothetical protein [Loxospora ochrophaea]